MIRHRSDTLTPVEGDSRRSKNSRMNITLSQSDRYESKSSFEEGSMVLASSPDRKQSGSGGGGGGGGTPSKIIRRIIPGSWHGEKARHRSNSPRAESRSFSGPPLSDSQHSKGSKNSKGSRGSNHSVKRKSSRESRSQRRPSTSSHTNGDAVVNNSGHRSTSGSTSGRTSPGLFRRLSKGALPSRSSGRLADDVACPSLYKHARKCQWLEFEAGMEQSPDDLSYVYRKDGTTALHMAIMSLTGYINSFKSSGKEFPIPSMELVEQILQKKPETAKVKCTLNGYTPLVYACLVCNAGYDVEKAAGMVRLFLKYCPDAIHVFTNEGLSPVDIHIVSYSHHHKEKEEDAKLGRTSTSVLRTLLTHSPELATLRLRGNRVEGPIEYLYKCNASAFSKTVMDEVYSGDTEDAVTLTSDFTIPERRQQVVDAVKKWWIWTWAVMILKYGALKVKKKGARFAAVHMAAVQVGCPTPLLSITIYAFPRQIKQPVEDRSDKQNLPLHAICSWPCHQDYKNSSSDNIVSIRKSNAIARVLEEYPLAVKVSNHVGETALELALRSGTRWEAGVRRIVKAYPKALKLQSKRTGLYPFMTAAAAAHESSSSRQSLQSLRTIYGLLRSNPKVLAQCWQRGQQQQGEEENHHHDASINDCSFRACD